MKRFMLALVVSCLAVGWFGHVERPARVAVVRCG